MENCDKLLRQYYRKIRRDLPCSKAEKNRILAEIQRNISEYRKETPDADFSRIKSRFGSPREIAAAYVGELDSRRLLAAFRMRKVVVSTISAGVAMALIILAVGFAGKITAEAQRSFEVVSLYENGSLVSYEVREASLDESADGWLPIPLIFANEE